MEILNIILKIIFGAALSGIAGFILAMLIAACYLATDAGITDMMILRDIFYICSAISFCVISYFIFKKRN